MPIYTPGKRDHRNRRVGASKRSAVAVLSLTAMVDMFTVLAVFLLQNYATTNQILYLPEKVELPQASAVKELKPSNVVIVSKDGIFLNEKKIVPYENVKEQSDWLIPQLVDGVKNLIKEGENEQKKFTQRLKQAVTDARKGSEKGVEEIDKFRKLTIQADKLMDFLTVKKVMYTITEAGAVEINFAVLKKEDEKEKGL
ncbi:MAG: biopolymer transporter ExbD [Bdellovibrionaceae bacterium]|nr:biopolymer transporter ExbD [Pseudobdellovibrionaceae bacterium]